MKKFIAAAAAAVMLMTAGAAQAATQVKVGVLSCTVDPGIGFIIGSSKDMTCRFKRDGYKTERYQGNIKKLGIDIGVTGRTEIVWLVFSASNTKYGRGSLAGTYVGGSAEATLGVGLGGNWLIGGSNESIALQPWSITGTIGVNWSWTWTKLDLN
jgi:opacity protein-like surface antigen